MPHSVHVGSAEVRDRQRGQLLHALDPRYAQVGAGDLEAAVRELCHAVDPDSIDCVLGFPEGGTPFALAAAQTLKRPLVLSTRMPHQLPHEITFDEPHNATALRWHYIYALRPGDRVVIVEDEITTGATLINAVRALTAAAVMVKQILVLMAVDDPDIIGAIEAEGVRVSAHTVVPLEVSRAVAANQNR